MAQPAQFLSTALISTAQWSNLFIRKCWFMSTRVTGVTWMHWYFTAKVVLKGVDGDDLLFSQRGLMSVTISPSQVTQYTFLNNNGSFCWWEDVVVFFFVLSKSKFVESFQRGNKFSQSSLLGLYGFFIINSICNGHQILSFLWQAADSEHGSSDCGRMLEVLIKSYDIEANRKLCYT